MDDLKKLTVRYLRTVARRYLGPGHSKLKTKTQLLSALKQWLPGSTQIAKRRQVKRGPGRTKASAGAKRTGLPARQRRSGASRERVKVNGGQHPAEPLIEGFFVARMGADRAGRRRFPEAPASREGRGERMTDEGVEGSELRMHAVARDPVTLFAFWDFPSPSWEAAAVGLSSPRPVLRVFQGSQLVQELDFTPEARGFYVHHLTPGQRYRVEAHLLSPDGRSRQVGCSSQLVELPRSGYSDGNEARFAQIAWDVPLPQATPEQSRVMDAATARALASRFDPPASRQGSSERRGGSFSSSGSGRF